MKNLILAAMLAVSTLAPAAVPAQATSVVISTDYGMGRYHDGYWRHHYRHHWRYWRHHHRHHWRYWRHYRHHSRCYVRVHRRWHHHHWVARRVWSCGWHRGWYR